MEHGAPRFVWATTFRRLRNRANSRGSRSYTSRRENCRRISFFEDINNNEENEENEDIEENEKNEEKRSGHNF